MNKGKGLIRSLNRRGTRTAKLTPAERQTGRLREPLVCEQCAAVFSRRVWRRAGGLTHARLERAQWAVCPACKQAGSGEYLGRVRIRGAYARANEPAIRRRIQNVAARAEFTQPQRRIVSIDRNRDGLEVLTTSQKLGHRIVHELKKAFQGRATYRWSEPDGALVATWERDLPARAKTRTV